MRTSRVVGVRLSHSLLGDLERVAIRTHRSRNSLLTEAVRIYLASLAK